MLHLTEQQGIYSARNFSRSQYLKLLLHSCRHKPEKTNKSWAENITVNYQNIVPTP